MVWRLVPNPFSLFFLAYFIGLVTGFFPSFRSDAPTRGIYSDVTLSQGGGDV